MLNSLKLKQRKSKLSMTFLGLALLIMSAQETCMACPTAVYSGSQNSGRASSAQPQWQKSQRAQQKRLAKSKKKQNDNSAIVTASAPTSETAGTGGTETASTSGSGSN